MLLSLMIKLFREKVAAMTAPVTAPAYPQIDASAFLASSVSAYQAQMAALMDRQINVPTAIYTPNYNFYLNR